MNKFHKRVYKTLRPPASLYLRLKFNYTYEVAENLPDTYIVLSNHVTDFDPFLVGVSFKEQMYFVASEHIARWKKLYKIIHFLLDPIMRYKGSIAASTVMEILHRTKAGSNICIFAEGARTWDGITGPILPSTGKLIKSAKCGLVTYKLTGGYFSSPNWSEGSGTRKGKMHGAPVGIYTKEQIASMSVAEINEIINRDLYEDAYARQLAHPVKYKGKKLAERMENLLFICPKCKKIDTMHSHGDIVSCDECGFSFKYNEYGMIENAPFKTVRELALWQQDEIKNGLYENIRYTSKTGVLHKIAKHEETQIAQGEVSLDKNALKCGDTEIPLGSISDLAMHGRHALVFTAEKAYYELLPDKNSNALKYMMLYEALKNNNLTQLAKR